MDLPVLDHVIIGEGGLERYSFREGHPEIFQGEYRKGVLERKKPKRSVGLER